MPRRGIDGLVHLQLDFAPMGYYKTPCSDDDGMSLYERLESNAPLTCLQCVTFDESSLSSASHGASGGQK